MYFSKGGCKRNRNKGIVFYGKRLRSKVRVVVWVICTEISEKNVSTA